MPENNSLSALISDANILIDYLNADHEIIALVSRHLAPLYVADIVAKEVSQLNDAMSSRICLTVIETPYSVFEEAANRPSSISLQDFACMRIAETRGWSCATNDKALRRECSGRNVPVLWGLELMLYLIKDEVLEIGRAKETAWAIHRCNKMITKKLSSRFLKSWQDYSLLLHYFNYSS